MRHFIAVKCAQLVTNVFSSSIFCIELFLRFLSRFSLLFFNSFHTLCLNWSSILNWWLLLWFTLTLFLLLLLFSVMLILLNAKKEFARSFNGPFYRYMLFSFRFYVGQCFIPCRPMHSWLLCRIYQRKFPVILLSMPLRIWTEFSFMLSFVSTTIQTIVDWAVNICFLFPSFFSSHCHVVNTNTYDRLVGTFSLAESVLDKWIEVCSVQ